jgi:hypothetical protein
MENVDTSNILVNQYNVVMNRITVDFHNHFIERGGYFPVIVRDNNLVCIFCRTGTGHLGRAKLSDTVLTPPHSPPALQSSAPQTTPPVPSPPRPAEMRPLILAFLLATLSYLPPPFFSFSVSSVFSVVKFFYVSPLCS